MSLVPILPDILCNFELAFYAFTEKYRTVSACNSLAESIRVMQFCSPWHDLRNGGRHMSHTHHPPLAFFKVLVTQQECERIGSHVDRRCPGQRGALDNIC